MDGCLVGKGAQKRIDSLPMETIVQIHTWEGLLYVSQRQLGDTLKAILKGDENPDLWTDLDRFRKQSIFYSQEYTKAILRLQFSQGRI